MGGRGWGLEIEKPRTGALTVTAVVFLRQNFDYINTDITLADYFSLWLNKQWKAVQNSLNVNSFGEFGTLCTLYYNKWFNGIGWACKKNVNLLIFHTKVFWSWNRLAKRGVGEKGRKSDRRKDRKTTRKKGAEWRCVKRSKN